jgi:hypothetical protein
VHELRGACNVSATGIISVNKFFGFSIAVEGVAEHYYYAKSRIGSEAKMPRGILATRENPP